LHGIEGVDQFFDGNDGDVFGTVGARDEGEDLAGLCPVNDNDGDAGGGVNASGDFEIAGGFLARGGSGGADGEASLGASGKRSDEQGCNDSRRIRIQYLRRVMELNARRVIGAMRRKIST